MLMLALVKQLIHQHSEIQSGRWPRTAYGPLRGLTLGLVGFGRTGQAVARRAAAFDMKLIAVDPVWQTEPAVAFGVQRTTLEDLLSRADIVTMHVPLTSETKRMMHTERFGLMKPGSAFINCARGDVVDEPALIQALDSGRLRGAGLDVFAQEPPGLSPLTQHSRVVLTAHTAGVDTRSRDDMARVPAEAIVQLFSGGWPSDWIVNSELRSRWKID
jgi:phosphoglycerate dehydrogenase-like enzyme